MSVLTNQTSINQLKSFFGAGGGGGPSGSTITVSTLVTSSIDMSSGVISGLSTITTGGVASTLSIEGDVNTYMTVTGGSDNDVVQIFADAGPQPTLLVGFDAGLGHTGKLGVTGYSTIAGNQALDSRFQMDITSNRTGELTLSHGFAGVSTIGQLRFLGNTGGEVLSALPASSGGPGVAIALSGTTSSITFLPQVAQACHSRIAVSTNTTIPQAGTTQNLGAFATLPGHTYDIRLPVRIDAVSAPSAGDWSLITTDTTTAPVALGSFDMTSVNATGNQWEVNLCGTVTASAATTTLLALGKPAAGTSTTVTVAGGAAFIRDLGIPQAP
jgi:hypothetical protein